MKQVNANDIPKLGKLVITDAHIGTKYECKASKYLLGLLRDGQDHLSFGYAAFVNITNKTYNRKDIISMGDNFELLNVLKKDIKRIEAFKFKIDNLIDHIDGNHSYTYLQTLFKRLIFGEHMVIHYDEIWGYEKAMKFKTKPKGCSWFKYHVVSPLIEKARALKPFKPKQKHLDNILSIHGRTIEAENIKYVHGGHTHVHQKIAVEYKGIVFIFYPRGVHEI